jgi:hypothetical protein
MEQVQQEINQKCKLQGCDPHVWFGNNYDLADPAMDECGYVVVDPQTYKWHADHTLVLMPLADVIRQLRTPECKEWIQSKGVKTYKFIPLLDKKHDFNNAMYGYVFVNMDDAVLYKLTWADK